MLLCSFFFVHESRSKRDTCLIFKLIRLVVVFFFLLSSSIRSSSIELMKDDLIFYIRKTCDRYFLLRHSFQFCFIETIHIVWIRFVSKNVHEWANITTTTTKCHHMLLVDCLIVSLIKFWMLQLRLTFSIQQSVLYFIVLSLLSTMVHYFQLSYQPLRICVRTSRTICDFYFFLFYFLMLATAHIVYYPHILNLELQTDNTDIFHCTF